MMNEVLIQREYYKKTAELYDEWHNNQLDEHGFALMWLSSIIENFNVKSVLDIGSGTGRALTKLSGRHPRTHFVGVEPSAELRDVAYRSGVSREMLIDGDAQKLSFDSSSFELVVEFGALHHIPKPDLAVGEMLRVASKGIFISDSNNYGGGRPLARRAKLCARALGLWKSLVWVKTGGRGYFLSESDGLGYSYSLFDSYKLIKKSCGQINVLTLHGDGLYALRDASHAALLGLKSKQVNFS